MLESAEQRRFRRYPIQVPFLHQTGPPVPVKAGIGWTRNMSQGGARVELAEPLQSATPLRLWARMERAAFEAEAQVVWVREPPLEAGGILHGVAFIRVAPDQLQTLGVLMLTKGYGRQGGVRLPYEVAVTCRPSEEIGAPFQGWTRDVSRGGLLLRLPFVLPAGALLEVTLHPPAMPIMVKGAVVWVAPPEGRTRGAPIRHGFQFSTLDWSTALSLGRVLAEAT